MSTPSTSAPRLAAGMAVVPSPEPRSRTFVPGLIPSERMSSSPLWRIVAAMRVKSPFSHSALFGFTGFAPESEAGAFTAAFFSSSISVTVLLECLGEDRSGFGDARGSLWRQLLEGRLEAVVDHARTDVGPSRGLVLLRENLVAVLDVPADRLLERGEVEPGLHLQPLIEEAADGEEVVHDLVELFLGPALGEHLDDQSVELRVLRFFLPMVEHQALEERVEVLVVADRAQVMLLGHPLDHQDHERDRERVVRQDLGPDVFGRADDLALDREAADESRVKALEQVNVLGFLVREIEDRADAPVVAQQMRARMIHQEREDELLDDPEDRQIGVRADLVEDALLERVEPVEHRGSGKAFRQEVARKVEILVLAKDVVELPLGTQRRRQRRLVIEVMEHCDNSPLI